METGTAKKAIFAVSSVDAGAPASTQDTKVSRQEVLKKGNVNTCSTDNPIV